MLKLIALWVARLEENELLVAPIPTPDHEKHTSTPTQSSRRLSFTLSKNAQKCSPAQAAPLAGTPPSIPDQSSEPHVAAMALSTSTAGATLREPPTSSTASTSASASKPGDGSKPPSISDQTLVQGVNATTSSTSMDPGELVDMKSKANDWRQFFKQLASRPSCLAGSPGIGCEGEKQHVSKNSSADSLTLTNAASNEQTFSLDSLKKGGIQRRRRLQPQLLAGVMILRVVSRRTEKTFWRVAH